MRHPGKWVMVGLLMVALGGGCQPPPEQSQGVVLGGSGEMVPLLRDLCQQFKADHPEVRFHIHTSNSEDGLRNTRLGLVDVGMLARNLRPEESDIHAFPLARDGLTFVVHKSNSTRHLTPEQVVQIYTRRITRWNEVGGPDQPISLVGFPSRQGIHSCFLRHFRLRASQVRPDWTVGNSEQVLRQVSDQLGALGYASFGVVRAQQKAHETIRLLPLVSHPPPPGKAKATPSPLCRTLHLVTRDEPQGVIRQFLHFVQSPRAHQAIRKYHWVPMKK